MAEPIVAYIETVVDPKWIAFVKSGEAFCRSCCGFWAYGLEVIPCEVWLVFDQGDNSEPSPEECTAAVLDLDRGVLRLGWYLLNQNAAILAWTIGVKRWGQNWNDAWTYSRQDIVLQLALLGEEKYG